MLVHDQAQVLVEQDPILPTLSFIVFFKVGREVRRQRQSLQLLLTHFNAQMETDGWQHAAAHERPYQVWIHTSGLTE